MALVWASSRIDGPLPEGDGDRGAPFRLCEVALSDGGGEGADGSLQELGDRRAHHSITSASNSWRRSAVAASMVDTVGLAASDVIDVVTLSGAL